MAAIRISLNRLVVVGMAGAFAATVGGAQTPPASGSVRFSARLLAVDANEGCAVADVNRDGQLDVIAGRNWYAAPDFAARPLRLVEDWNGYVQSNGDLAWDVNGDGWVDVIAGSFVPTGLYWYQNPGAEGLAKGQTWRRHLLAETKTSENEGTFLHDIDRDGVPEVVVNSWNPKNPLVAWQLAKDAEGRPAARRHLLGRANNSHGIGFGDVNNDGREDILVGTGWYERPAGDPFMAEWTFHPDWQLDEPGSPMIVRDLTGDGRNDVVWGKGHDFGLFWRESLPAAAGATAWREHTIDQAYSQVHALLLADVDGDGEEELIAGMRKWAHNGKDPGDDQPPSLHYYEWNRTTRAFVRHTIDAGRAGTGLQIRAADLNLDGRLDLAVAGKSGTYILFNEGL
jgi:hypothetical protein